MGIEWGLPSVPVRRPEPRSGKDRVGNQGRFGNIVGGVVSPILSNIYLDRLDQFVEQVLFPEYNRGTKRKPNKGYRRLRHDAEKNRHVHPEEAARLRKQMQ